MWEGGSSWPREEGVSKSGGAAKSFDHLGNSGAVHRGSSSTRRTLSKRVPGPCVCVCVSVCARTRGQPHVQGWGLALGTRAFPPGSRIWTRNASGW